MNLSVLGSLLDEKKVPCNDSSLTSSEDLNFEFLYRLPSQNSNRNKIVVGPALE